MHIVPTDHVDISRIVASVYISKNSTNIINDPLLEYSMPIHIVSTRVRYIIYIVNELVESTIHVPTKIHAYKESIIANLILKGSKRDAP